MYLCAAAAAGDMRQLTRLIDNGIDPNVRDYDQRTAFHIAARRGCLKVIDYLCGKAEINAVDRSDIALCGMQRRWLGMCILYDIHQQSVYHLCSGANFFL